jgi:hypothetical protein
VDHPRRLPGIAPDASGQEQRGPRLGDRQDAVRQEEPPHVQRGPRIVCVADHEAHRAPPAHRDEAGGLHDAGHAHSLRHERVVERDGERPHQIGDVVHARLGERLAGRGPEARQRVDRVAPPQWRRLARRFRRRGLRGCGRGQEQVARAHEARHARAPLRRRLFSGEARDELLPVFAPRLGHVARRDAPRARGDRREPGRGGRVEPRPRLAREALKHVPSRRADSAGPFRAYL